MSKFSVWIDDINVSESCQSSDTFASDSQRINGFKAGTGASAIRVNTALRQANLISVALVNALGIPDTFDVTSSLQSVEDWIKSLSIVPKKLNITFDTSTGSFVRYIINDTLSIGDVIQIFVRYKKKGNDYYDSVVLLERIGEPHQLPYGQGIYLAGMTLGFGDTIGGYYYTLVGDTPTSKLEITMSIDGVQEYNVDAVYKVGHYE